MTIQWSKYKFAHDEASAWTDFKKWILPLDESDDLLIIPSESDIFRLLLTERLPKLATKTEVLWELIGSIIIGEGACISSSTLVEMSFKSSSCWNYHVVWLNSVVHQGSEHNFQTWLLEWTRNIIFSQLAHKYLIITGNNVLTTISINHKRLVRIIPTSSMSLA